MKRPLLHVVLYVTAVAGLVATSAAQSSDQLFPTPIRTSEITSLIKARTVGDPRVTTYYYTFEGEQGDVFINVQAKNFTGDIDVFAMPGQTPLTKIVIYGDQPETETGRVVYLRKPERLILRVQGRSPGDEDASLRIKFAGSFAVSRLDDSTAPEVPKVDQTTETNVRVNSVGTIIEVIPKATPTPAAVASRSQEAPVPTDPKPDAAQQREDKEETVRDMETSASRPVEVVVSDPVKETKSAAARDPERTTRPRRSRNPAPPNTASPKAEETTVTRSGEEATPPPTPNRREARRRTQSTARSEEPKPDPMANINLVIYFKDGSTVERPMTEVMRFSVERAVLTVISKNGTIGRYNMVDVLRVSIE